MSTNISENRCTDLVCPVKRLYVPVKRLHEPVKRLESIPPDYAGGVLPELYSQCGNLYRLKLAPDITLEDLAINGHQTVTAPSDVKWLSDFLRFESFKPGGWHFIKSDTGSGKTTFIERDLVNRFEKILYVTNRSASKGQFLLRNQFILTMKVLTYQAMEENPSLSGEYLDTFQCVVFDEIGYLLADALISGSTYISLRNILSSNKATKILLSATIDDVKDFIMEKLKNKYGVSTVSFCTFFHMKSKPKPIRSVSTGDWDAAVKGMKESTGKWIVFVKDKKRGLQIKSELGKSAVFVDADSARGKGRAAKIFQNIIASETFSEEQYLVCTTLLDSGVNICDKSVIGMVIDCDFRDQIIQMVGRKRFVDDEDFLDLFLINTEKSALIKTSNTLKHQLGIGRQAKRDYFNRRWPGKLANENSDDGMFYRKVLYNDTNRQEFYYNELAVRQVELQLRDIECLLQSTSVFKEKLKWIFGEYADQIPIRTTMSDVYATKTNELLEFLNSFVNLDMEKLGDNAKCFRAEYTQLYWKLFGKDLDDKHRSDKVLSFEKINRTFIKRALNYKFIYFDVGDKKHVMLRSTDVE